MKQVYKTAIAQSIPYIVVIAVIGLALYLNALIVQDNITLDVAVVIGYILLTILIGMEIFSLILIKLAEIEKTILIEQNKVSQKKLNSLEKELDRIKNK